MCVLCYNDVLLLEPNVDTDVTTPDCLLLLLLYPVHDVGSLRVAFFALV